MSDEEILQEIIAGIGKSSERWGLSKIPGEVWGLLYFKGAMTQDKIKEELKCSLSSISQSITMLENFGLVETIGKEGRKKLYNTQMSLGKIKRHILENMLRFEVEPLTQILEARAKEVSDKNTKEKVSRLSKLYSRTGTFIKLILKIPFGK